MMPVLKKSERTPRLGTIKGGMEAVMVRATTGRRAGSRKGCKLLFKSSRNFNTARIYSIATIAASYRSNHRGT